jgi:hypothetical protein
MDVSGRELPALDEGRRADNDHLVSNRMPPESARFRSCGIADFPRYFATGVADSNVRNGKRDQIVQKLSSIDSATLNAKFVKNMAPQAGLEPATLRLTG